MSKVLPTMSREKAREYLTEQIAPGMTIFSIVRRTAASGMSRMIDLYVIENNQPRRISHLVAGLLGKTLDRETIAIRMTGCGSDSAKELVRNLSTELFSDGQSLSEREI
jgi:hypothetical protein